jgi:uncharacterized protein with HEPN domain
MHSSVSFAIGFSKRPSVPPREWLVRIEDMLDAIGAVLDFVQGMTFDTFREDRKTVDAVVRNLEVMGEAARNIPDEVRDRFPEVPWSDIVGIRSVLIHEYFGVDMNIVWKTIESDLPPLLSQLRRIIENNV